MRIQKTFFEYLEQPTGIYRVHDSNLTLKKYHLGIKEQERWIKDQKRNKKFIFKKELKYIEFGVKYKKIKLNIFNGEFLSAFKNTLKFPMGLNKLKLIIFLLFIPRGLINIKSKN